MAWMVVIEHWCKGYVWLVTGIITKLQNVTKISTLCKKNHCIDMS